MLEKTKKINNFLLGIVFLLFCFTPLFLNTAIAVEYKERITPKERAVFSFFRKAGRAPDYDFWIKSSGMFSGVSDKNRASYILDETLRLGRGYSSYDEDEDLLELTIYVIAKYISATEDAKPRITFEFFQTEEAYVPTFSYPYGEDAITLIIDRLAVFANIPLDEDHSEAILSKVPYKDEYFDAKLVIHVRVSSADINRPIIVDDVTQWMMVGEVAYLECEAVNGADDHLLWDYVAPWYVGILEKKNMPEEEKYPHPYDLFKD